MGPVSGRPEWRGARPARPTDREPERGGWGANRWHLEPLSDGEVHFLWHFIQGSIMVPETRQRLVRAWGMCARHSFAYVAVEAAFRPHFLHGPALLWEDLMERASRAFDLAGPLQRLRLAHRLRERGPCLICELGYGPGSRGVARPEILQQGRSLDGLRQFAAETERCWRPAVCGRCAGSESAARCRVHLREELLGGSVGSLARQAELVRTIAEHVRRFSNAFRWELHGTDTVEDRAALVSAVGWCAGWQPWLWLLAA